MVTISILYCSIFVFIHFSFTYWKNKWVSGISRIKGIVTGRYIFIPEGRKKKCERGIWGCEVNNFFEDNRERNFENFIFLERKPSAPQVSQDSVYTNENKRSIRIRELASQSVFDNDCDSNCQIVESLYMLGKIENWVLNKPAKSHF